MFYRSFFLSVLILAVAYFLFISTMATYPPTCANTTSTQGMNMANSIANLRLKAKEYSLNQVPTVN